MFKHYGDRTKAIPTFHARPLFSFYHLTAKHTTYNIHRNDDRGKYEYIAYQQLITKVQACIGTREKWIKDL